MKKNKQNELVKKLRSAYNGYNTKDKAPLCLLFEAADEIENLQELLNQALKRINELTKE